MHTYNPCVLLHVTSLWGLLALHLSVLFAKLERKKDKKKYMNKISAKDKHFGFYRRAIGTQQFTKTSTYL